MAAEMLGAAPEELDNLVGALREAAETARSWQARVADRVGRTTWAGPDLMAFQQEWAAVHAVALARITAGMLEAATAVVGQAVQQREASAAGADGAPTVVQRQPHPPVAIVPTDPQPLPGWKDANDLPGDVTPRAPQDLLVADDTHDPIDVMQGRVGDCWVIASLGALARSQPSLIQNHIRRNADGTYTVTLFREVDDGWLPWAGSHIEQFEVVVSASYFVEAAHGRGGVPNWATIYEKAIAASYGQNGYQRLDEGGDPAAALARLTGRTTTSTSPGDITLSEIQSGLEAGRAYVASTGSDSVFPWWDDAPPDQWIVPNHAYIVDAVTQRDGTTMIHLVNPWGTSGSEAGADHERALDVWLTEQQFRDNFQDLSSVGGV